MLGLLLWLLPFAQDHIFCLELDESLNFGLAAHHRFLLLLQVLLHGIALLVVLVFDRHHLAEVVGPAPQNLYKLALQAVGPSDCDLLYVNIVVGLVQVRKGFGGFHNLLFATHGLFVSELLLLVVPVGQQIVDVVGDNKDTVSGLALGLVLQQELPFGAEAVDNASGGVVDDEELVSLLVALL